MQILQRLEQRTTVADDSFPLQEQLARMHLLYHPSKRIRDVLHHEVQVCAGRQGAGSLCLFLEEEVMQADNAVVVDLLKDIELSILVFFILKDVLHGKEFFGDIVPHLARRRVYEVNLAEGATADYVEDFVLVVELTCVALLQVLFLHHFIIQKVDKTATTMPHRTTHQHVKGEWVIIARIVCWIKVCNLKMFEIQPKKSGRSAASKNNSSSRGKLTKKETLQPKQRILLDTIQTDTNFKDMKSKSQCQSKQRKGKRKSIDVCKFMQTARSTNEGKKTSDRPERVQKLFEQIHTEDRGKHQNYLVSNLTTQKSADLKCKKGSLKKATQGRSTQKKRILWNDKCIPYAWPYVVQHYSHYLTKYEQGQIKQYKKIYYLGHKALKRERTDNSNPSFDTQEKEYKFVENDHIAYRYQLLSVIGKGSYGQVFKAFDHKTKEQVALKVIKNQPRFSKQAFIEIKILSHIKEADLDQQSNVVRIKDFVIFRKHVCILFQLLSNNLYELIIRNNYNGLNEELIRRFAIQILVSLEFLRNQKIIHCDLKPQNILLKEYNKSGIKIIDFGSSCFQKETLYTYIQSRYYRAPEITLGIPYNHCIDIWSTGCILAELYTGVPVFPGENQYEQMKYMTDSLGVPPAKLLDAGSRKAVFFDEENHLLPEVKALATTLDMFSKPMRERIDDPDFLSFIELFLKWDPYQRVSPLQALTHSWIRKGLPEQLKTKLTTTHDILRQQSKQHRSKEKRNSSIKISKKTSQERVKRPSGLKLL